MSLQVFTYYVRTAEDAYAAGFPVSGVYQEAVAADDAWAQSMGLLGKETTVLNLWKQFISGTVPAITDRLVDPSGSGWQVRDVKQLDRDVNGVQRYQTLCVSEQ